MDSVGLTRIGDLFYGWNTVTNAPLIRWDGSAQVTHEFTPNYDDAGKEILSYDHNIGVTGVVATDCIGAATHEQAINLVRQILSQPNHLFVHKGGGMGDLAITGGLPGMPNILDAGSNIINQPCIANGPMPQVVTIRPMGRNAAYVDWRVRFSTINCLANLTTETGQPSSNRIASLRSSVNYSIDENGLTSRTVNAVLKIWNTLTFGNNNGKYTANPDAYRDFFIVAIPPHFRRTNQSYTTSEDRRQLTISVSDVEIESRNPYPTGVLKAEVQHKVNVTQTNLGQIRQTMSGSFTMPPRMSVAPAFSALLGLIQSRTAAGGIVTDFSFTENIFGSNGVQFNVSWYQPLPQKNIAGTTKPADLSKLFEVTGLFSPAGLKVNTEFQPYNWQEWDASVSQRNNRRGVSGLQFNNDSASQGLERKGGCQNPLTSVFLADTGSVPVPVQPLLWTLENEKPPETSSFYDLSNEYTLSKDERIVFAGYEQDRTPDTAPDTANALQFPQWSSGNGQQADFVTFCGEPDYKVRMKGYALRFGYEIPRPKLASVGSAPCHEIAGKYKCAQVGWALNIPIYGAAWDVEYKLPHSPGNVTAPGINPPETSYG